MLQKVDRLVILGSYGIFDIGLCETKVKRFLPTPLILGVTLLIAACTAVGERTTVSVGYYTVSGETFDDLDRDIRLHGPNVTGVGKALASTDLRMLPDIRYQVKSGECAVTNARINVKARVTLPRHRNERVLKRELAKAWNNLEEYARIHEAVHLAIADRYALLIEDAVMALKPHNDCNTMRVAVQQTFDRLFEEHHAEQLQFDLDEKIRIRRLISQSRTVSDS